MIINTKLDINSCLVHKNCFPWQILGEGEDQNVGQAHAHICAAGHIIGFAYVGVENRLCS